MHGLVAGVLQRPADMPVADPRNTRLGLLLTAAGIPAYLYWRRHR